MSIPQTKIFTYEFYGLTKTMTLRHLALRRTASECENLHPFAEIFLEPVLGLKAIWSDLCGKNLWIQRLTFSTFSHNFNVYKFGTKPIKYKFELIIIF